MNVMEGSFFRSVLSVVSEVRIEGRIFCRQTSEGDEEVIDDQTRRKKVKISPENLRDGGEWDFKSGGSYWNSGE